MDNQDMDGRRPPALPTSRDEFQAMFHDAVEPFINSILGVAIFFCPVFYHLDSLSSSIQNILLFLNPFTYLILAFRTPLLGEPLRLSYYVGTAIVTVINIALGLGVFTRARSRLPYWVA